MFYERESENSRFIDLLTDRNLRDSVHLSFMLLRPASDRVRIQVQRLTGRGLQSDAVLYGLAAAFSIVFALTTDQPAQWQWGYMAVIPYAFVALLALVLSRLRSTNRFRTRIALAFLVLAGAVLAPLILESRWRHLDHNNADAQPEVSVIERSAQLVQEGKSPYKTYVTHGRVVDATKGIPTYESFFPYFPLMSIFGLPSVETHDSHGLTDARIVMSTVTLLLSAMALALMRAPPEKRLRVAQVLLLLPTGALFLATGGDDMPIIALMLLAVVFMQRRAAWSTGITIGIAAAMKLTAWPFAHGAMLVSRDKNGRPAWPHVLIASAVVVGVTATPYALKAPVAFISNVFSFPLGISGVSSPAASALPGHILTTWWPVLRHGILPAVFVVGGYFAARYVKRSWPLSLDAMLRFLSVGSLVVICAATATRVGYIIYPIDFAVWAWALKVEAPVAAEPVLNAA